MTTLPKRSRARAGSAGRGAGAAPGRRALLAYVRKDLRQNLGTFAVLLGIVAVINTVAAYFQWQYNNGYTNLDAIINVFFLPVTQITIAITLTSVGFLLGCAQIRGDSSLDIWGFLVHRPAARSTLFFGRLVAGAILYLAIAGIPLALFILYSTTSYAGEFFYWRFTLPSVADFLAGFVYYLAGLLVAQSTSTLVGPRMIALVAAIACSFCIRMVDSFALACLIIATFTAMLLLIAYGSFHSHGFHLKAPRLSHAARICLICCTLTALLGIPFSFAQEALDKHEAQQLSVSYVQEDYFQPTPARTITVRGLLPDGTLVNRVEFDPAITTRPSTLDGSTSRPSIKAVISYTTLDGKPLPEPVTANPHLLDLDAGDMLRSSIIGTYRHPPSAYHNLAASIFSIEGDYQEAPGKPYAPHEKWFFVKQEQRFYIYAVKSRAFVGTFGQHGFAPPGTLAKPFDSFVAAYPPLVTSHAVFLIDPNTRSLNTLFTTPAGEPIRDFMQLQDGFQALVTPSHTLIFGDYSGRSAGFPTSFTGLSPAIVPVTTLPLAHPLDQFYTRIIYLPERHRWALLYGDKKSFAPATGLAGFVDLYDQTGTLLRETQLDWTTRVDPPYLYRPSPETLHVVHRWQTFAGIINGTTSPLPTAILHHQPGPVAAADGAPYLTATFLTSAVLALFSYFLLRRYNYSLLRSLPWLLGALLLGLPTVLTFLATHAYPRRAKCPACGKSRPFSINLCPHCGAPWPPAPATGTEIFTSPA